MDLFKKVSSLGVCPRASPLPPKERSDPQPLWQIFGDRVNSPLPLGAYGPGPIRSSVHPWIGNFWMGL